MSSTPETLEGVAVVSPQEALKIQSEGGMLIAAFTHMTDWCMRRAAGSTHITMDVPKDHKRTDFDLALAEFDVEALPEDKDTPIVFYCADNN
jgi:rhodanese-related sulfurtransferase